MGCRAMGAFLYVVGWPARSGPGTWVGGDAGAAAACDVGLALHVAVVGMERPLDRAPTRG